MPTSPTTATWKPIDFPAFNSVEPTSVPCELSREHWPNWAADNPKFRRIGLYRPHPTDELYLTSPSTGTLALLTERIDLKDFPKFLNYNVYLVAKTTDDRLFQSGPLIPTELTHHSSSPHMFASTT